MLFRSRPYFVSFLRLTVKILSFLRLTAKFLADFRLTVNPIETLTLSVLLYIYPGLETFEFDQGRVTKNQPITVLFFLSKSLAI